MLNYSILNNLSLNNSKLNNLILHNYREVIKFEKEFLDMEENPFTITEKVVPKYFCDRKEETARMIRFLTNRNNVVLLSPRRIGKTALIQYCFENREIKKNYNTFYIDILSTTNLQEFVFLFGKQIYNRLRPLGKKIITGFVESIKSLAAKISYDPLSGVPVLNFQLGDITRPEYTLEELFAYLGKAEKPSIVAIDEFQQISKYPEQGVEALIRSHILQINNCRFIFSGSERHLLGEMFLNSSRPFYQSSSMIELKPIERDVYVKFIRKMFTEGKREIDKDLAEDIYDRYFGNTFCIQRICNSIYSHTQKNGKADRKIWDIAEEEILFSYDTLFRERLSRLTLRQKEVLFAVANENIVKNITSTEFLTRNSLSSISTVQSSLRSLMNSDLLIREGNEYLIADRFMSLWIKNNYLK